MASMRAVVVSEPGAEFELVQREIPEPEPGALARVAALLPGQHGAAGLSPAERYAAYDRRFLVPPERLAVVIRG